MNFDYYEEGTLLQKSNNVTITILNQQKNSNRFYKDAEGKDIAPPKSVTGKLVHPIKKTPRYFWLCFYKRLRQCGRNNDRGNKRYLFYYRLGNYILKRHQNRLLLVRKRYVINH